MTNRDLQEQAQRLARVIVEQHDHAACTACLDMLEEYVAAQLARDDYLTCFPAIAQHLDSCVDCAESYALLYQALSTENVPLPMRVPEPDLSFLQENPVGQLLPGQLRSIRKGANLADALAAAIERTGKRLKLTLSQALLDLLPPPQPAFATRSTQPDLGVPLFELEMDDPGEELMYLHMSVYREVGAPNRCTVRVQVTIQGRAWPDLAGIPVILRTGSEQQRKLTDPWGEVVFTGVPAAALPGLQVEVEDAAPMRT